MTHATEKTRIQSEMNRQFGNHIQKVYWKTLKTVTNSINSQPMYIVLVRHSGRFYMHFSMYVKPELQSF